MLNIRKEIKELVRELVINSVNCGDNVLSADEVDLILTMNMAETVFFNNRIKFDSYNILHIDEFIDDDTVDIDASKVIGGLIGSKPVFNSDGVFIHVDRILKSHYEPRLGGSVFHYVGINGDITAKEHYNM